MTAGKRPRLMMRRTVSVASLGGAGAAEIVAAAGSEHHQHPPRAQQLHAAVVVPPRQVIGFAPPKDGGGSLTTGGDAGALSGGGGEFSSPAGAPSPGAKSRPFSGLSMLADPSGKEPGGSGSPPHHLAKVGLGIVAALDKNDLACSSPTSVIRAAMAQAGVANNYHHYHQQQQQHHQQQHHVHVHGRGKQQHKQAAVESAAFQFCLETDSSKCSLRPSFTTLGFLESCYQCKRDISHGRDIFMYRGDKAFCSAECRHQQILNDERSERREKCTSAALKQMGGGVPQQARRNERAAKVTPATTAAAA